ncbi:hypothetical protein V6N13_103862 [Hibiscus sabdariffa]|uniref:Uncharacterized protein n=2 Tax=Hibiscus sabdariffa TaxID=183260 RepID=A0ABR2NTC5_9ROSI
MAATTTTTTTTTTATEVSLKLLIDKIGQRVLCAEADKDFVDFLFNILLLPVGTVTRLLTKEAMVGSLGNLYQSVENFRHPYILPTADKFTLLNPKCSPTVATNVPLLLPNVQSSTPQGFYRCSHGHGAYSSGSCCVYYTNDPRSTCPSCSRLMNSPATFVSPSKKVSTPSSAADDGGYVRGVVTYTIMDDLTVAPMSTISSIVMLSKFNVKQVDALEERVVNVGINEGVELLKASLQSKTVLTDVFLTKTAIKTGVIGTSDASSAV